MTQIVTKTAETLEEGFVYMKEACIVDYNNFIKENTRMQAEFAEGLQIAKGGTKYMKVLATNGVWGFIVKEDGGKFKKGDILKAAGWNAPAKNAARGNILEGNYPINWTGPLYLN